MLSEASAVCSASPILRQHPIIHKPMESGVRPIHNTRHVPMLHRIPVDVVHMPGEVDFVAYQMLPIPSLQDAAFALVDAAGASMFVKRKIAREPSLDEPPA